MNKTTTLITTVTLALGAAMPVFAIEADVNADVRTNVGGSVRTEAQAAVRANVAAGANLSARLERGKDRAEQEIQRRTEALQRLTDRVGDMRHVTDDIKSSISATVQAQISALAALRTKIAADTDLETLKADIKSITESYRIFMLVLPQGRITTAADHIKVTADKLATISGKLAARINEAQGTGADTAAAASALAELNMKIASAKTGADAAASLTTTLKPDNGDKAVAESNRTTLKDAQAKLKTAQVDLVAARKSAGDIVKSLKGMNANASTEATTSASAEGQ